MRLTLLHLDDIMIFNMLLALTVIIHYTPVVIIIFAMYSVGSVSQRPATTLKGVGSRHGGASSQRRQNYRCVRNTRYVGNSALGSESSQAFLQWVSVCSL